MSWKNVEDKHRKNFERDFVSCGEYYERQFVIDTIVEEFPFLVREKVKVAVDHCCIAIPPLRPIDKFLQCVADNIK